VIGICSAESKARIEATEFSVDETQVGEEYAKCGRGERGPWRRRAAERLAGTALFR
jgi:hypothetical protein